MIARQRLSSAVPSSPARRRVGLLFSGDVADPGAWSGIPFALARALAGLGVEIVPLDVRPLGAASGVIVNGLAVVRAGRRGLACVVGIGTDQAVVEQPRDWSAPRFLFVGQDWERKNGEALLRSFERLRRAQPNAELHLVGGHPRVDLEGVVGHGVLRLGVRADRRALLALYRLATCLVLPSLVEPSAIVHVEAAAFGVPSIGTSVGGSRELIGDGGRVVDPHDDRALLDALTELSRPETAASLGRRAQRRAPLYTWNAVAARILTALGVPGFVEPELQPPA